MVQVEHEHPYQAIIDTGGSKGCDLIVMASHGRHGISAIVLGSETLKVLSVRRQRQPGWREARRIAANIADCRSCGAPRSK